MKEIYNINQFEVEVHDAERAKASGEGRAEAQEAQQATTSGESEAEVQNVERPRASGEPTPPSPLRATASSGLTAARASAASQ